MMAVGVAMWGPGDLTLRVTHLDCCEDQITYVLCFQIFLPPLAKNRKCFWVSKKWSWTCTCIPPALPLSLHALLKSKLPKTEVRAPTPPHLPGSALLLWGPSAHTHTHTHTHSCPTGGQEKKAGHSTAGSRGRSNVLVSGVGRMPIPMGTGVCGPVFGPFLLPPLGRTGQPEAATFLWSFRGAGHVEGSEAWEPAPHSLPAPSSPCSCPLGPLFPQLESQEGLLGQPRG